MNRDDYTRLAAPAPADREADQDPEPETSRRLQPGLDAMCEDWAHWCRSRRLYVKPSMPKGTLGRLTGKERGRPYNGGPDAANSAEMAAFHIAFLAQPEDALDRKIFELHYYTRVRNVKAAADALHVSRQHWYRLKDECAQRIYIASRQLLARNLHEATLLRSRQPEPGVHVTQMEAPGQA